MQILANTQRTTMQGRAAWFTGSVWIDTIVSAAELGPEAQVNAASVTFTPGSRTAWHTHPRGQTLFVLSGAGLTQKEGEPIRPIRAGDVVVIPANENHWPGADATHTLVHLAIQEVDDTNSNVTWGRHVTEEEYGCAK